MGCRLSIITPVFNGIRFIEACIRNVIDQQCPGVEHIIIDGGSTDGTAAVIERYASEYRHIRWLSEPDRGQSDAMNKGIALAVGEIVGFLNVDDYYELDVLNRIVERFSSLTEPALLVGNCNIWDDHGSLLTVNRPSGISYFNLLKGDYETSFPMNPSAYFYHKSLHGRIGLYDVDEHFSMDVHFIYKAVQQARVVYVDELWGNYRFLKGTKTYMDDRSGQNQVRVAAITDHYRKSAPLQYRARLAIRHTVCRLCRLFTRSA